MEIYVDDEAKLTLHGLVQAEDLLHRFLIFLVLLPSKYRYELQKKKREQQKKSIANRVDLKELKMGYNIDVRLKAARKFLNDGDKVKIIVNLKGRESEFRNNAIELVRRFQNDVGESYNRDLFLFLYFLLIIVSAITSFKIHHDKSPISGKSILYLNRHQTEEWKGWMQVGHLF